LDELSDDEFRALLQPLAFPGREELLRWLAEHSEAHACRAPVPEDDATKARDARKIWEIRQRTTQASGLATGHMQEAITALKTLEATAPSTPVVVTSVEGTDRTWIVFSERGRAFASLWVAHRVPAER